MKEAVMIEAEIYEKKTLHLINQVLERILIFYQKYITTNWDLFQECRVGLLLETLLVPYTSLINLGEKLIPKTMVVMQLF